MHPSMHGLDLRSSEPALGGNSRPHTNAKCNGTWRAQSISNGANPGGSVETWGPCPQTYNCAAPPFRSDTLGIALRDLAWILIAIRVSTGLRCFLFITPFKGLEVGVNLNFSDGGSWRIAELQLVATK